MKQFEDGDPCFAPMLNALFAAFRGTVVMDGCVASATGTSRAVSITAGSVQIDGVEVAVGAGSVTLDAGGSFDRYDLISVNATGSKIVTKGVSKRKCPAQPANTCLLAIVFMSAGATVIATGDVYDARMLASQAVAAALQCSGTIAGSRLQGVIPLPPEASRLHAVPVTPVSPAVIGSGVGPYSPNYDGQALYSYTVPTNLAGYGVPASHGFVKLTVEYTYSSGNISAVADVHIGGISCSPLTVSGAVNVTKAYSLWAKTGSTIIFYGRCPDANEQHTPTISNISITLTDCFPANQILASDFGALVGLPGSTLTPYHLSGPAGVECTCNFDGALATMSDFAARPYFPLRPISVNLNWKSGYGWAADPPALTFYKGV